MNTRRATYIDLAKGFGMLCVLWGHIHLVGASNLAVYACHMPLFFIAAGMVYKKEKYDSLKKLVVARFHSLLLPYFFWSLMTWLLWCAKNALLHEQFDAWWPLLQTFAAQGSGNDMLHNVPLWFIPCLFTTELLYYFVCKLKSDGAKLALCLAAAVLGYFLQYNSLPVDLTRLPWSLEAACTALLFYGAGNLFVARFGIAAFPTLAARRRKGCLLALLLLTPLYLAGALYNGEVTLGGNNLGNSVFLYYLNGFGGSFLIMLLCALLETSAHSVPLRKALDALLRVGRNSFYFMVIHFPLKGVMLMVITRLLHTTDEAVSASFALSMLVFVPTVLASAVFTACVLWCKRRAARKATTQQSL